MSSSLRFAQFSIANQVFYQSKLSLGIVNLKPIVPGHVLVIPRRVVARFGELEANEVAELYQSVHQISKVIERQYEAQSLSIAMQDGPYAGQSVPHVHVHILPRRGGDFDPLDSFYEALDDFRYSRTSKLAPDDNERKPRTAQEMQTEAKTLSDLFPTANQGVFDD